MQSFCFILPEWWTRKSRQSFWINWCDHFAVNIFPFSFIVKLFNGTMFNGLNVNFLFVMCFVCLLVLCVRRNVMLMAIENWIPYIYIYINKECMLCKCVFYVIFLFCFSSVAYINRRLRDSRVYFGRAYFEIAISSCSDPTIEKNV